MSGRISVQSYRISVVDPHQFYADPDSRIRAEKNQCGSGSGCGSGCGFLVKNIWSFTSRVSMSKENIHQQLLQTSWSSFELVAPSIKLFRSFHFCKKITIYKCLYLKIKKCLFFIKKSSTTQLKIFLRGHYSKLRIRIRIRIKIGRAHVWTPVTL